VELNEWYLLTVLVGIVVGGHGKLLIHPKLDVDEKKLLRYASVPLMMRKEDRRQCWGCGGMWGGF